MIIAQGSLIQSQQAIANGTATTGGFVTNGLSLVGIFIPAAFTSTEITFSAATALDGTYVPVKDANGAVTYTVAPGEYLAIDPTDFYGIEFLQINTNENEGAARSLICMMKGI